MKYDLDLYMAELNEAIQRCMDRVAYVGTPPGMPGNDLPGLMGLGIGYDEVYSHRVFGGLDYQPVVTGLALDRDRIRAHLRILHSTLMRNYTVTFEQFNNGVKRLSCDELEIPSEICGYRAFGITDTAEAVAEVRKHGYRLNAVGMTRFRRIK